MDGWHAVARAEEIPAGGCKAVIVDGRMIAVIRLDDAVYAIDNVCTHDYAELCDGMIFDDRIQCPLHGAQFNIKTGAVAAPPAYEPLRTYEVRIVDGTVEIKTG